MYILTYIEHICTVQRLAICGTPNAIEKEGGAQLVILGLPVYCLAIFEFRNQNEY